MRRAIFLKGQVEARGQDIMGLDGLHGLRAVNTEVVLAKGRHIRIDWPCAITGMAYVKGNNIRDVRGR